jgi:hypothetical protein
LGEGRGVGDLHAAVLAVQPETVDGDALTELQQHEDT